MAYEKIIKVTLPVLQQGHDTRVPLRFKPREGASVDSIPRLAATDRVVMALKKSRAATNNPVLYTFSTEANTIDIDPVENALYLFFTDTATLTFPIDSETDMTTLYGTLYVKDTTAADPRMDSKFTLNIKVPIRPALSPLPPVITP